MVNTLSFTEIKRVRKNFGKLREVSKFPNLIEIQKKSYEEFLKYMGLKHTDKKSFVFNTIKILDDNGIDTKPLTIHDNDNANYVHSIMYYLLNGKNCAYCSCDMFLAEGELVKKDYWNKFCLLYTSDAADE